MKSGTYVRGWKFDWGEAKRDFDNLMAANREWKAASVADPGCCSCPQCGEYHWREFEVFLCSRCGAECSMGKDGWTIEAGPPAKPEMCRKKLFDGMRVRYVGKLGTDINGNPKRFSGRWPAGKIEPGECGTICCDMWPDGRVDWTVDFDGRTPKEGCVWGVFGPFLHDEFEEVH